MKQMHKLAKILVITITIFMVLGDQHPLYAQEIRINVAASFYPLAEFASRVGGEYVNVINITPAGSEPHDYEPTPMDIKKIYSSRIFIMNGDGVDPWAGKIKQDLLRKGVIVVDMMGIIRSYNPHTTTNVNPHIWLDPVIAQEMVLKISKAIQKIDPEHTSYYKNRTNLFIDALKKLDKDYAKGLSACKLHDIITSHDAFPYLAKRYGFYTHSIAGLSPEEEPSPKTIARLIVLVREKHIRYIFFERLVSPKLSDTIAHETGAKTLVLDPIEGLTEKEVKAGKDYLVIMQENLKNLRQAMECNE